MEDRMMTTNEKLWRDKAQRLTMLLLVMNRHTFGYREAAEIIGGRARLDRLIGQGRVRAEKKSMTQNGKIYCNAGDVLRYAEFKL